LKRATAVALIVLSALPWVLAHHTLNYAIGGVWKPANTVAEYMAWPGSPFSPENLTGFWRHAPGKLVVYAAALLFGKHGFIGHNLPLFLLVVAIPLLYRSRPGEYLELFLGIGWCIATWLTYAAFSNNYGGACCSVRWFVPFLAPLYFCLAIFLRDHADYRADFAILSVWGGILAVIMWSNGPWITRMVPWFWQSQVSALLSWSAWRCYVRSQKRRHPPQMPTTRISVAA
jgi:hypothetical protein